jgi:hypothetical protein
MAHTYITFDFGADEEKAQQARHKLEGWKQAFRLDKKLQIKFDRGDAAQGDGDANLSEEADEPEKPAKSGKGAKPKSGAKAASKGGEKADAGNKGEVKLFVRLYFSGHEKMSEKQWLERIPADDLFKGASPKIIRDGDNNFADTVKHFDSLE